jgi:hypothetical protein
MSILFLYNVFILFMSAFANGILGCMQVATTPSFLLSNGRKQAMSAFLDMKIKLSLACL